MKINLLALACVFLSQSITPSAIADEEFAGIIESRPETKVGTWIIGGRSIEVTERARLDEDHGPLSVGACAEVEFENGLIEEIESQPPRRCGQ
jgi:hypothetical protein